MAEATLNGLEEAADFNVTGWDLDADKLVVLLHGGVGGSRLVVDVAGDILGQAVADITEALVVAVDFVGVVAVSTLPGVHLKVVGSPALGSVYRTAE